MTDLNSGVTYFMHKK